MNEIGVAYVRLRSDSTGYQAEVERGVKAGFSNVRNIIGGAFAAAGVFEGAKAIIETAAAHQSAFAVVDQTLKNAKQATTLYGQSIEGLLEKESRLKGFHDEDLASSFVRLVSATHNSAQAFKDLQDAEDVSRARHIEVTQAALAEARAERGNAQSLSRLGIVIHATNSEVAQLKKRHDEAVASGAKFNASQNLIYKSALAEAAAHDKVSTRLLAFQTIQDRFGGSAAKFAQTASGQFQRTEQDIHQFEVSVGEHALPVVNSLAEGIGKYAVELTHSQSVQSAVTTGMHDIATVGGDIRDVIQTIGPTFLEITTEAERAVSAIGAPAIVAAIGTYKVLGVATAAVATAEAFYQRTLLAGMPVKAEAVAANTALAGSEAAVAAAGDTAAAGGIGAFARGVGQLGLAAAGGPVGLAIAGVAVLAGTIVYAATETSAFDRAANSLRATLGLLNTDLNRTKELALGLAQSKVDVALAKDSKAAADAAVQQAQANEKATRGTKEHQAAVLALRTARDQDAAAAVAVQRAEQSQQQSRAAVRSNAAAIVKARADEIAKAEALALLASPGGVRGQGRATPFASPGFGSAATDALQLARTQANIDAAAKFSTALEREAIANQKTAPHLAASVRLLEQFATAVGRVPKRSEIQFILDPTNARKSLREIEHELGTPSTAAKFGARKGGYDLGAALSDGVKDGIAERTLNTAQAMVNQVLSAIGAGKAAAAAHSPSRRAATEIGLPLAQGVVVGINTGAPDVQKAMNDLVGSAISQGGQQVADAINQAKQNLNSIGGSLASDIGQILNQPLQAQQQALSARQNRLTLDQLKRSIILPGGHTLSANDAVAQRQLERLASGHGMNQAALQGVLGQFTQDRLAVQQDQVTARANAATSGIVNITDLFNKGAINAQQANRRIARLLAADHITYKVAGRELGVAFADGFQGQLTGLRDQIKALVGSPRLPGSGLAPSIVRPIETLRQAEVTIAQAAKDQRSQQLAESRKQTKLMEQRASKEKAADFIKGLPKSERAAVIAALTGTK